MLETVAHRTLRLYATVLDFAVLIVPLIVSIVVNVIIGK